LEGAVMVEVVSIMVNISEGLSVVCSTRVAWAVPPTSNKPCLFY
jgi:hypothetical protein